MSDGEQIGHNPGRKRSAICQGAIFILSEVYYDSAYCQDRPFYFTASIRIRGARTVRLPLERLTPRRPRCRRHGEGSRPLWLLGSVVDRPLGRVER